MTYSAGLVLLLVVLCSGYVFNCAFNLTKQLSAREDGHRLYFRAATYGYWIALFLAVLGFLLDGHITECSIWRDAIKEFSDLLQVPIGYLPLFLSIPFAWAVGKLFNFAFYLPRVDGWRVNQVFDGRDFESLIYEAVTLFRPLLVTLESGKVYAGLVLRAPDPSRVREYLKIVLVGSGYRDKKTQEFVMTTDYINLLSGIASPAEARESPNTPDTEPALNLVLEDLSVVLSVERIISIHPYDDLVHGHPALSPPVKGKITAIAPMMAFNGVLLAICSTTFRGKSDEKLCVLVLCALLMMPASLFAMGENHFFLSAGLGQALLSGDFGDWQDDDYDNDTTLGIDVGYRFHDNLAVELGYKQLGDSDNFSSIRFEDTDDISGFNVGIVGIVPLLKQFELYGKLGLLSWESEVRIGRSNPYSRDIDGTDAYLGFGGKFHLNEQLGLGLEVVHYGIDDEYRTNDGVVRRFDDSVITISGVLSYKF